jgi:hypothetical protein
VSALASLVSLGLMQKTMLAPLIVIICFSQHYSLNRRFKNDHIGTLVNAGNNAPDSKGITTASLDREQFN